METEQYIALIIDDDSTATSELRKGLAAHPEFTVAGAATTATAGERLLGIANLMLRNASRHIYTINIFYA